MENGPCTHDHADLHCASATHYTSAMYTYTLITAFNCRNAAFRGRAATSEFFLACFSPFPKAVAVLLTLSGSVMNVDPCFLLTGPAGPPTRPPHAQQTRPEDSRAHSCRPPRARKRGRSQETEISGGRTQTETQPKGRQGIL